MPKIEIQVAGYLNSTWKEWLEGFTFTYTDQDETILNGAVVDQAALYGLFAKLRDMGVQIISLQIERQDFTEDKASEA